MKLDNRKAQGCRPGLSKEDCSPSTSIPDNFNHDWNYRLLLAEIGIQYAQKQLEELSVATDRPGYGLVESADALDLAYDELVKAKDGLE